MAVGATARATGLWLSGLYFLDDNVFVEGDGFWVRGGQAADVVIAAPGGRRISTIELMNGGTTNLVEVSAGAFRTTVPLAPSESHVVDVPLSDEGVAAVRVSSQTGFRPSDSGGSQDTRFWGAGSGFETLAAG